MVSGSFSGGYNHELWICSCDYLNSQEMFIRLFPGPILQAFVKSSVYATSQQVRIGPATTPEQREGSGPSDVLEEKALRCIQAPDPYMCVAGTKPFSIEDHG